MSGELKSFFAGEGERIGSGSLVVLTGAGVSAESGIPTFRGPEGYWRVGSVNYHPQELARASSFARDPETVWRWYLHRRAVCREAEPNLAHRVLAECAAQLDDFFLITQNVDGLHGRAGSPPATSYEIHGNIERMRCSAGCGTGEKLPTIPDGVSGSDTDGGLRARLTCLGCGAWMRPHVLWFDESYDEPHFRFESSLRAARGAALLVIVGTTGATNLPNLVAREAAERGAVIVVINPEPTVFSRLAEQHQHGLYLSGTARQWLPSVLEEVQRQRPRTLAW